MNSCVLYFLAVVICSWLHEVNSVKWEIIHHDYPKYFESDTVTALCSNDKNTSPVSILKDNVPVAIFNKSGEFSSLNVLNAIFLNRQFVLVKWEDLKVKHSGIYTCQSDDFNSANLSLKVIERPRKALCEAGADNRLKYLAGEHLELNCYNPFKEESPALMPNWFVIDTNNLQQERGILSEKSSSRLSTANISLRVENNSTTFKCYLTQNDNFTQNESHLCSVGPIFVYNSSFVVVEPIEGSSERLKKYVTLNCRIVPPSRRVSYQWFVDPSLENIMESTSDMGSNLTLSGFESGSTVPFEAKITCLARRNQQNLTGEYILTVSSDLSTNGDVPIRLILIASSGLLGFTAAVVTICGCRSIMKRLFQRSDPKGDPGPSMRDNGAKNGDEITRSYFCESELKESSEDYLTPSSKIMNTINPEALTYRNCQSYCNIEQANHGIYPEESYESPRQEYPNVFGRYTAAPHRGPSTARDAHGRPLYATPHHCRSPMANRQPPLSTTPETIPTWDDEISFEEDYPPEYERPLEEGIAIHKDINDDLWDYENAGVRK